jgi:hypothetical protein
MHARVTHLATGSSSLWLDGRQFGNQRLRQLAFSLVIPAPLRISESGVGRADFNS